MNPMNDFEDENPFEQDGARIPSETSSTSQVALYEPPSPPRPNLTLSPVQNVNRPPFPSPGSHRLPQANYKTDICCSSDRFLHSGDDIEILVRHCHWGALLFHFNILLDCRRAEDIGECELPLYYICHSNRCTFTSRGLRQPLTRLLRMPRLDIDIQNSKVFETIFPSCIPQSSFPPFPRNKASEIMQWSKGKQRRMLLWLHDERDYCKHF